MKKTILLLATVFFFLNMTAQKPTPLYLDDNQPIEKRIDNALSLMTLDEKVALCHAQSKFSSPGVPRLGIPEIWWSDGPHGIREEVYWDEWTGANWTNDSCTAFPALTSLAATFNPELSKAYGIAIGEEARYRGKDVLLGPGVNIYRTPLNGRNFEYMGEDPYLASTMVVPYIQGVQQNGVAASKSASFAAKCTRRGRAPITGATASRCDYGRSEGSSVFRRPVHIGGQRADP